MKVLLTGGAGFIGSHLLTHILKETDWEVICLDRLDCSGNLNRLTDCEVFQKEKRRVRYVFHDLKGEINSLLSSQIRSIDIVLHLAASTHVDRSIEDPLSFVMDNVVGTAHLLNWARQQTRLQKFFYMGTDEIFGPVLPGQVHHEWDRYNSTNPYSASKAGAEELCLAFANCYQVPVIIGHTMNTVGERQHYEKYVPSTIRKVYLGEKVIIHGYPDLKRAGSRFYIHARNTAAAILFLLEYGTIREKYNIVGEREIDNLELAKMIAAFVGKPLKYEIINFHQSRPGHDLHYGLDGTRMKTMGWKIPVGFEQSLQRVVQWSLKQEHRHWLGL